MIISALLARDAFPKPISGILLGIGAGILGLCITNLLTLRWESRNPELARKQRIEEKDERSGAIRDKAKAQAGDVTQWLIIALAFLSILREEPIWVTLVITLVFLTYSILSFVFMKNLQRKM